MRVLLPLKKKKQGGHTQQAESLLVVEEDYGEQAFVNKPSVALTVTATAILDITANPSTPTTSTPNEDIVQSHESVAAVSVSPSTFWTPTDIATADTSLEPTKKRARVDYTTATTTATKKSPVETSKLPALPSNMTGGRRTFPEEDGEDAVVPADEWQERSLRVVVSHGDNGTMVAPLENEPPPYRDSNNNNNSNNNRNIAAAAPSVTVAAPHPNTDTASANSFSNNTTATDTNTTPTTTDSNTTNEESLTAFIQALKKRGLEMVPQEGDGNCLFRAVSLQVYGDADQHLDIRQQCCDFMARDPDHFGQFVVGETFVKYIARKRQEGVHGNHAEIQAVSELFNRPVQVWSDGGGKPLNIFHAEYKTTDAPIRLSYHDGNHYNAVIDPLMPTAGLGLGLPDLKPGLADQLQVAKAVTESDQLADEMELQRVMKESQDDHLQRALKESAYSMDNVSYICLLRSASSAWSLQRIDVLMISFCHSLQMYQQKLIAISDLDAANFELEQKVLQNSLESYRRQEAGRKQRASPTLGRRRRGRSSPSAAHDRNLPAFGTSSVAAIPPAAAAAAAASDAAAVAGPSVAFASSTASANVASGSADEYPQTVQELVMNGFELAKVVHAYELIGDNFDDLLMFLMSNNDGSSSS